MLKQNHLEVYINAANEITIQTAMPDEEFSDSLTIHRIAIDKDDVEILISGLKLCLETVEEYGSEN